MFWLLREKDRVPDLRQYAAFDPVGLLTKHARGVNSSQEQTITSMAQLIHALERTTRIEEYVGVLGRLHLSDKDVLPYCHWNSRHYTRTCIARTADFELLAVCYEAGQRTSIHDYNSQTAWIHPVSGEVLEERFAMEKNGLVHTDSTVLKPGSFSVMSNGQSIHRFTNAANGRTVTLNLYARPLKQWRVYNEHTGRTSIRSPNTLEEM